MRLVAQMVILLLANFALLAQETPASQAQPKMLPGVKPFVGTWRLSSSQETLPDGTLRPYGFGPHPVGMLMYDAHGNMCAQVVNSDRPKWKDPDKPTPDEIRTAFDGFGGYCGTYTVDEKNGTMAHHPEVSFDPNLVAQPKPRSYRFEGNRLIYSGTDKNGVVETNWVMIWEKVK